MAISNEQLAIEFNAMKETFASLTGKIGNDQMRFNILKGSLDGVTNEITSLKENQTSMMKMLEAHDKKFDSLEEKLDMLLKK